MKEGFCKYAQKVMRSQSEADQKAFGKGMRSYVCESCGFWHLTSRPKRLKGYDTPKEYLEVDYG